MNVEYLIQILSNKLIVLNNAKTQSFMSGDLATINSIDTEILGVQDTLAKLKMVQDITAAASATNTTAAQIVANGVTNIQNVSTLPVDPTAVFSSYDLSTYAADPIYFQKITDILSVMPILETAQSIDTYIADEAIGSPLTGQMIFDASIKYSIDIRMLVSILELESNFGTAGVAVRTNNPGNVGNTGSATRTYDSWQDGVSAVAQWLSRHTIANLDNIPSVNDQLNYVDAVLAPAIIPTIPVIDPLVPVVPITVPPTLPVLPASPVVNNGTSTPVIIEPVSTSTSISTDNSTTTNATSTPSLDTSGISTTTPPILDMGSNSTTTNTTSSTTPSIDTSSTGTSTPILNTDIGSTTVSIADISTTTQPIINTSTTTPDTIPYNETNLSTTTPN